MDNTPGTTTDLPPGRMRLKQQKRPMLPSGGYTIRIDHKIEAKNKTQDTIRNQKRFAVNGERFRLDDALVYATYPPVNGTGDFSSALPHIVIANATLPWERSAGALDDAAVSTPWLALLLFYQEDLDRIKTDTLKIKDLRRPKEWLESGEDEETQCTVLNVPADLLCKIIPDRKEMEWLCHVREVRGEKKADTDGPDAVDYAVVIGNRRPETGEESGKTNRAHLVSLEAYYDDARSPNWYAPQDGRIQLVSLASWTFTSTRTPFTFEDQMGGLGAGTLKVEKTTDDPFLQEILSCGYTLLPHQMRQGGNCFSLYRGPLAPCRVPSTVNLPVSCGDEAVRFYSRWGLTDVSYAAAWQLGRILALGDGTFTEILLQWKNEQRRILLDDQARKRMEEFLGGIARFGGTDAKAPERDEHFERLARWLAELMLLIGVPFHYLVPDLEQMLPPNAIRFFQVDANWIDSLLDGAFSLGRETTADRASDRALFGTVCREALRHVRLLRPESSPHPDTDKAVTDRTMSGAIVRSQAIAGWPGIEVNAFGGDNGREPLPLLRFSRLSDDMLICIFEGEVSRIVFHPPAEGMHFDIRPPETSTEVRHPDSNEISEITTSEKGSGGRVNITELAEAIQAGLVEGQTPFTSAQLALSLIATSQSVTFTRNLQAAP